MEDVSYSLCCVSFANKTSSRNAPLVHIPYCKWPEAWVVLKDIPKHMVFIKKSMLNYDSYLRELSGKEKIVNM